MKKVIFLLIEIQSMIQEMIEVNNLGASPGGGDSLARYRAANGERQNVSHSLKSVFLCIAHHPLDQGNKKGTKQSQV